jgi:hypothetical protein
LWNAEDLTADHPLQNSIPTDVGVDPVFSQGVYGNREQRINGKGLQDSFLQAFIWWSIAGSNR